MPKLRVKKPATQLSGDNVEKEVVLGEPAFDTQHDGQSLDSSSDKVSEDEEHVYTFEAEFNDNSARITNTNDQEFML